MLQTHVASSLDEVLASAHACCVLVLLNALSEGPGWRGGRRNK